MLPDYYRILGVHPSDSFDTIKSAYRQKAMQNHPDRGGSVEAMKEINEAWEVLSKPQKRQTYDAVRANPNNPEAFAAATQDAKDARQRSEDFPRKWSEFEQFLNKITEDFQNAKYGQEKFGPMNIPKIDNSVSGQVFIIIGALIFGCVFGIPFWNWLEDKGYNPTNSLRVPAYAIGFCAIVGAWIGAQCHKAASSAMNSTAPSTPVPTPTEPEKLEYRIFTCDKCQQRLRVPRMNVKLAVTCSKCGDKFEVL